MDQKLLLEVDLVDDSEPVSEKMKLLKLLSRPAVEGGELDSFGDRVFTDARIRKALSGVAADPPASLMQMLNDELGTPAVPDEALRRSLARVLDAPIDAVPPQAPSPGAGGSGPPTPPKGHEYPLDHHLGTKSTLIRELFEEVDKYATTLGADVTRRVRKQYIGYFRGKRSFFTTEIQQRRVLVYLALTPANAQPWNDDAMRDATGIGHFGMGDTEYSLRTVDQLDEIRLLIQSAYQVKT